MHRYVLSYQLCDTPILLLLILHYSGAMTTSNGKSIAERGEENRVFVDNTNLSELKSTCDDAVERVSERHDTGSTVN